MLEAGKMDSVWTVCYWIATESVHADFLAPTKAPTMDILGSELDHAAIEEGFSLTWTPRCTKGCLIH